MGLFLTNITMIERVSLCSSNSPLGLIINELHRMTLRGTVKQYVYDITNHMSLESCRKLRGLTHLLSEQNLQVSMSKFFVWFNLWDCMEFIGNFLWIFRKKSSAVCWGEFLLDLVKESFCLKSSYFSQIWQSFTVLTSIKTDNCDNVSWLKRDLCFKWSSIVPA